MTPESILRFVKKRKIFSLPIHWEMIIAESPDYSYQYANFLCRRFYFGELTISKCSLFSILYAVNILKGRFLIAEKEISKDPQTLLDYANHVIKGQLPKDMHKKMLIYSFKAENKRIVEKYMRICRSQKPSLPTIDIGSKCDILGLSALFKTTSNYEI